MKRTICVLLALLSVSAAEIVKRVIPMNAPTNPSSHKPLNTMPLNVAAMEGDTVLMRCEADAEPPTVRIHWWEFVTNDNGQMISDNNQILASHPNSDRYSILQATPTQFYLEISDVSLADGGTYTCLDGNSGPPAQYSGQAELIVLEANPNCTNIVPENGVVMEGQNYSMSCEVNYAGGMAPSMTWSGPEPFITTTIPNPDNVYSAIAFTVNRDMDTRAYQCLTNFTEPSATPGGVASNAPDYEHVFQSGQLFVYWGPKNMSVSPVQTSYVVGDILTCYADAFPSPFYRWQNMITLDVINSQEYNITEDMVGLNTTLRCEAQNLIQGFIYSANYFIAAWVPEPTTPTTTPTTTTPPAEANCNNLTGWWLSDDPYAELHLTVDTTGQVTGFMRNHTDQQWVEVVGRTRTSDYSLLGLTAIWPYEVGVTGMSGECHNCHGVERIMTSGAWRSSDDSVTCGHGGTPSPYVAYDFRRVSDTFHVDASDFQVHQPSKLVSGKFGLKY